MHCPYDPPGGLVAPAEATLEAAERSIEQAAAAEREYRRATWHYCQLLQHRIRNPLQVIIGIADTLAALPDLDPERREALVSALADQARVLRDVSAAPECLDPSERSLGAIPIGVPRPESLRRALATAQLEQGQSSGGGTVRATVAPGS